MKKNTYSWLARWVSFVLLLLVGAAPPLWAQLPTLSVTKTVGGAGVSDGDEVASAENLTFTLTGGSGGTTYYLWEDRGLGYNRLGADYTTAPISQAVISKINITDNIHYYRVSDNPVYGSGNVSDVLMTIYWGVTAPCAAPTAQATSFNFGSTTATSLSVDSFTPPTGGADGYAIYVNTSNSFTAPSDGTEPTANTTYSSGQQCVYFGTSSSPNVKVSGLGSQTTYYFKVYAYNDCSGTETYETTGLSDNNTTSCASPTTAATSLNFGAETTNSIIISDFTAPSGGADGYAVYVNTSDSFTAPAHGDEPTANTAYTSGQQCVYFGTSNTPNVTVTGLASGTEYFVKVYSYEDCTGIELYETTGLSGSDITCTVPTAQATSLNFGTKTTSTLTVSDFTAPSGGATGYAVYVNSSNSFTAPSNGDEPTASTTYTSGQQCVYFGTSTSPSITVTGLNSGTTYYFTVYAYNDCNDTELYETTGLSGSDITCNAPTAQATGLNFGTESKNTLTVSDFTAPSGGAVGYAVYVNSSNSFTAPSDGDEPTVNTVYGSGQQCVYFGTSTSPDVTVTGLNSGTTYYFTVYSYNDCNDTELYEATGLSGSDVTCTPPTAQATSLNFGAETTSTLTVSDFTAPSGGATGYAVYVNTSNSFTAPSDGDEPAVNTVYGSGQQCVYFGTSTSPDVTVTGLNSGTTYYFTVYSYNDCNDTELYEATGLSGSDVTCTPPTAQATSLNFGAETTSTLTVSDFTAPSGGATGYAVYVNTSNSFTAPSDGDEPTVNTVYGSGEQCIYFGTSTSPSVTVTGLSAGTDYYFTVYAYNDCNDTELYETTGLSGSDNTTMPAPSIAQINTDDEGALGTGNTTFDGEVTLSGTTEPDATVQVYLGGNPEGSSVTADGSGSWVSNTISLTTASTYSLTAVATKNTYSSSASSAFSVTISAPAVTGIADDTGSSNSDGVTSDPTLVFSGTSAASQSVAIHINGSATPAGTVTADASGDWVFDHTATTLADGDIDIVAKSLGVMSDTYTVTLDATAPDAPSQPDLAASEDSGEFDYDNITNDNFGDTSGSLVFSGTAEPNSTVKLYEGFVGKNEIADVTADVLGNWTATVNTSSWVQGYYLIEAKATDSFGNTSDPSLGLFVIIDRAAAAATITHQSGLVGGGYTYGTYYTSGTNIKVQGVAEGNSVVEIFVQGGNYPTKTKVSDDNDPIHATGDGSWSFDLGSAFDENETYTITADCYDLAGNLKSTTKLFDVDTTPPSPVKPSLESAWNSGSTSDLITNNTNPRLTGSKENQYTSSVELFKENSDGSVTSIGTYTAYHSYWYIHTGSLTDGTHRFKVKETDAAGNVSPDYGDVLEITIDTQVSSSQVNLTSTDDSGVEGSDLTDDKTNVKQPTLYGTTENGATVRVYNGGTLYGTTTASSTDGSWSFQIPSHLALADASTYTFTTQITDIANNTSGLGGGYTITTDQTAPEAPSKPDLAEGSDSNITDDDNTSDNTPTFTGTAEANSYVYLYITDEGSTTTLLGETDADGSGNWSYTVSDGSEIADGAYTLAVKVRDHANNESSSSEALAFTIDTTAPANPTSIVLHSGNYITNADIDGNSKVIVAFAVEGAETDIKYSYSVSSDAGGDPVTLEGDVTVADVTYSDIDITDLGDGTITVSYTLTDIAGNTTTVTDTEIKDVINPKEPSEITLVDDSGTLSTDNLTNVVRPEISGWAEASSTVSIYNGDDKVADVTADAATSEWKYTFTSDLAQGSHMLKVVATDMVGNTSVDSQALTIRIDTDAPAHDVGIDLTSDDDSGAENTDGITNVQTPTIFGFAEAKAIVTLFIGGVGFTDNTVNVDANNQWSFKLPTLSEGLNAITLTLTDSAGNVSPEISNALNITVDITDPVKPTIDLVSDTHNSDFGTDSDNLTNETLPDLSGTAEEGTQVVIYNGTDELGSATAQSGDTWTFTVPADKELTAGSHNLKAVSVDGAGNDSESDVLAIEVDTETTKPTIDLAASDDSGISDEDNLTNENTLTFSGKAEANSKVTIYNGSDAETSVRADASGDWTYDWSGLSITGSTPHDIKVIAMDPAGNSLASDELPILIDRAAPSSTGTIDLVETSDSHNNDLGTNTDNLTNISTPKIGGELADGALVTVLIGGVAETTQATVTGGKWEYTLPTLSEGDNVITVKVEDAAGNITAESTTSLTIELDTEKPSVPTILNLSDASDSFNGRNGAFETDNVTNETMPTFDGDGEVGAKVDIYDRGAILPVTETNGIYLGSTTVQPDGTWSFTVPADKALSVGMHNIAVILTDKAGNESDLKDNLIITIDTQTETPSKPDLVAGTDSGRSDSDNVTNVVRPEVSGTAEAMSKVEIMDGSDVVGTVDADGTGAWSYTFASDLSEGLHVIKVKTTDKANNTAVESDTIEVTIDVTKPSVDAVLVDLLAESDTYNDDLGTDSDNLTMDVTPTLQATVEDKSIVMVYVNDAVQNDQTVTLEGTAWEGTLATLSGDPSASYKVELTLTDIAGNVSDKTSALTVVVDTEKPSVPTILNLSDASDSFNGRNGAFETDNVTNETMPTFDGDGEVGAKVDVYDRGAILPVTETNGTYLGSTTVQPDGTWSFTVPADKALSVGMHNIAVILTDKAGNESDLKDNLIITIDTQTETPSKPDLVAGTDSGRSDSDNVTNVVRPEVSGTAEAMAKVEIMDGSDVVGTVDADGTGAWSYTFASDLSEGLHVIKVKTTDKANNTAVESDTIEVTIDVTKPSVDAVLVDLLAESDTHNDDLGTDSDNLTMDVTPTLQATVEDKSIVMVYVNDAVQNDQTVTLEGTAWEGTLATLSGEPSASYKVELTLTDIAGNVSDKTSALTVVVDTEKPAMPNTLNLADEADSFNGRNVAFETDNVTKQTMPTFDGDGEVDARVDVYDRGAMNPLTESNGTYLGSTTVQPDGTWSFTVPADKALSVGMHNIAVVLIDKAGNESILKDNLIITIDTQTETPSKPDLVAGTDSGRSDSDNVTNVVRPEVSGTAEAMAKVEIMDGNAVAGTVDADGTGAWSYTFASDLSEGLHVIKVNTTDKANNTAVESDTIEVTIDTTKPSVDAVVVDLLAGSDSHNDGNGYDGVATDEDNLTQDNTPTFKATVENMAIVMVYVDDALQADQTVTLSGTEWESTLLPLAGDPAQTYKVELTLTDIAGNVSNKTTALNITVDQELPVTPSEIDLVAASDTDNDDSTFDGLGTDEDNLTSVIKPTFTGKAEAGSRIDVYDNSSIQPLTESFGTLLGTVTADDKGVWTFAEADYTKGVDLAENGTHVIKVVSTDLANNASASASFSLDIDTRTVKVALPNLVQADDSGLTWEGTTLDMDNLTNAATPKISGVAGSVEGEARLDIYNATNGGTKFLIRQINANADGSWEFVFEGEEVLRDATSNVITIVAFDKAGNNLDGNGNSSESDALTILIDRTAPVKPSQPDLVEVSDTKPITQDASVELDADLVTDNKTKDVTPEISGTTEANTSGLEERNTLVTITVAGDFLNDVFETRANAAGEWSYVLPELASGEVLGNVSITVTATDAANNTSVSSDALTFVLDTTPPAASTLDLITDSQDEDVNAAYAHISAEADDITDTNMPTIQGVAEAHSVVEVKVGSTLLTTIEMAETQTDWEYTLTEEQKLSDGIHTFSIHVIDEVGNPQTEEDVMLMVRVDTDAPLVPSQADLFLASDSGYEPTDNHYTRNDNITNNQLPTIGGVADESSVDEIPAKPADSDYLPLDYTYMFVKIYERDDEDVDSFIALVPTGTDGKWEYTFTEELPHGKHRIVTKTVDRAGNETAAGEELVITVDVQQPTIEAGQSFTIKEISSNADVMGVQSGDVIGALKGSDVIESSSNGDNSGQVYTWMIEEDALGLFRLDPATGILYVADDATDATLDREGVAEIQDGQVEILVSVLDIAGNKSENVQVTVSIEDVNEIHPVITGSDLGEGVFAVTIDEITTIDENPDTYVLGSAVIDLEGEEGDQTGEIITWEIVDGNIGNAFAIDDNGLITVANPAAINFEAEAFDLAGRRDDATKVPTFELKVVAYDGGRYSDEDGTGDTVDNGDYTLGAKSIIITLNDVNETPYFQVVNSSYSENSKEFTAYVQTGDPDIYNTTFKERTVDIVSAPEWLQIDNIDPATGQASVAGVAKLFGTPNLAEGETLDSDLAITLSVTDNGSLSKEEVHTLNLSLINDTPTEEEDIRNLRVMYGADNEEHDIRQAFSAKLNELNKEAQTSGKSEVTWNETSWAVLTDEFGYNENAVIVTQSETDKAMFTFDFQKVDNSKIIFEVIDSNGEKHQQIWIVTVDRAPLYVAVIDGMKRVFNTENFDLIQGEDIETDTDAHFFIWGYQNDDRDAISAEAVVDADISSPINSEDNAYEVIVTLADIDGELENYELVFPDDDTAEVTAENEMTFYNKFSIFKPGDIYIPNLFSPNGDGENETFFILSDGHVDGINFNDGESISEITFIIVNAEGRLVYETSNVEEITTDGKGWNGTVDGVDAPEGTYVWKMTGKFSNGDELLYEGEKTGRVTLIR